MEFGGWIKKGSRFSDIVCGARARPGARARGRGRVGSRHTYYM